MSYSGNQIKNPNGKLSLQIAKADIYNNQATYENIIVKIQLGNEVKQTPSCAFSKNITWIDTYDLIRSNQEDNFQISLIHSSKKGEEVLGSASVEINQFMQRARKQDYQADLQLNGKNTSSVQLKIMFTKSTEAEILASEAIKATENKSVQEQTSKKIQDGLMNEASKKLKENELETNYVNKAQYQNCKYLITITNIKANFTRDTDIMSKMDPYIKFRVSEEINFKTTVINGGGKTPEWKEELKIPVGLEEVIAISALDNDVDSDDLIGTGFIKIENLKEAEETKNIPLEFEKKKVGDLIIKMSVKITPNYEKQNNIKGKIALRNISSNLKSSVSNSQIKFNYSTENKLTQVNQKGDKISYWLEDTIIIPVKDTSQTQLQIGLQSVTKQSIEQQGSCSFDLKQLIEKEKWYIQEQISLISIKDKKEQGHIIADIQYIDLKEKQDEKLHKLKQNEGVVRIRNMKAFLTRDTDTFGKMDPYCVLNFNNNIMKTATHNSGGKEPIWKDSPFDLNIFTYQKDKILKLEVLEEDPGKDDVVGNGQIDLTQFVEKKGKYLGQKVEISFQGKPAGEVYFDVESEENMELKNYLEKKKKELENEQLQKKILEDEMALQKENQEKEKNKQKNAEEQKKKLEEEEKRKKLEEEDRKKKQQEEEDKKKKLDEEKKKQEAQNKEMELKRQNEEKQKKQLQQEQDAKKRKEEEEKRLRQQQEYEEQLKRKQQEEENQRRHREENDQRRSDDETSNSPSRTLKTYSEYQVAMKNLEEGHGFGMSEYQSATSLQKSTHAFSMPKAQRFTSSDKKRENSPDYVQLPSIFDTSAKRGVSFGIGKRGVSANREIPGPGQYQDILPKSMKGYTFGISRSKCKNYIDPNFASPIKERNRSSEKQQNSDRYYQPSYDQEYSQPKQQNRVYIDQNKLLKQQQHQQQQQQQQMHQIQQQRLNRRNDSNDQRRNQYHQQPITQRNPSNNIRYKQNDLNRSFAGRQGGNNGYAINSSIPKIQNNYHYSQGNAQKNNQSYLY